MSLERKEKIGNFFKYAVLIIVGLIMIYPLLWMVGATFKSNAEIFTSIGLIPKNPTLDGYKNAFNNYGGKINLLGSMINTYSYVIPKVIFTVISATIAAYGFGRFRFKGRDFLFALLMSTLFLPQMVLNVPQFTMFTKVGWVDSPL
ncbi:MAG: carbohydrate ABC transporter permease, partial [Oscillospiraceae bacterium]|nr:carbohydrate ABC transporter permease [Oscillospiraceae bacterium]